MIAVAPPATLLSVIGGTLDRPDQGKSHAVADHRRVATQQRRRNARR